jgi:hypothetical protein
MTGLGVVLVRGYSKRAAAALSFVFLALSVGNAGAQPSGIAAFLFPEAATWRVADQMPALKRNEIDAIFAENLWDEIDSDDEAVKNSAGCEASIRLFFSQGASAFFHHVNLGDKNSPGLFYSGDAPCREGGIIIVWQNTTSYMSTKAETFPATLLRIEDVSDPHVTAIERGCCGDPIDVYLTGKLLSLNLQNAWHVENDIAVPNDTLPTHQAETISTELILRSAPIVNDAYQADRSHFLGQAAFGNVERRYLPGATVTVIAKWKDATGRMWNLVEAPDSDNNYLCTYSSTGADVGWMVEKP